MHYCWRHFETTPRALAMTRSRADEFGHAERVTLRWLQTLKYLHRRQLCCESAHACPLLAMNYTVWPRISQRKIWRLKNRRTAKGELLLMTYCTSKRSCVIVIVHRDAELVDMNEFHVQSRQHGFYHVGSLWHMSIHSYVADSLGDNWRLYSEPSM